MTKNEQAFLDMIAISEIGAGLLAISDNGYNVLVGSTLKAPLLFNDYSSHPRIYNKRFDSTAAGRYQLLYAYYAHYIELLGLKDFSPASQDAIALRQIKEFKALPLINAGKFEESVFKVRKLWASLPAAGYNQHEQKIAYLKAAYINAGGEVA